MRFRTTLAISCLFVLTLACGGSSSSPGTSPSAASAELVQTDGRLNVAGTWASIAASYLYTLPGGPSGMGTEQQTSDVRQFGEEVFLTSMNSSGYSGACRGKIRGKTVWLTCDTVSLDKTCTATGFPMVLTVDDTASPMTLTKSEQLTLGGDTCALAGLLLTGFGGTFTKQSSPTLDVAGNWSGTAGPSTLTPPGVSLGATTLTYTTVQTGSSVVQEITSPGNIAYTCAGPIIGDMIYTYCEGTFPPFAPACNATGSVTQTVNANMTPLTENVAYTWTLGSDCGSASGASLTGTGTDTRQ